MSDPSRASSRFPLARNRTELLALMHETRVELMQAITGLDPARCTGPCDTAGWSVKDHLAHVVAWEQILLDRLAGQTEPQAAGISEDNYAAFSADGTADPTDALNEILFERWQYVPLDEVLGALHSSHGDVRRTLERMTDADLLAPLAPGAATTRMRRIAEDAYWHYADHAAWIRAILG